MRMRRHLQVGITLVCCAACLSCGTAASRSLQTITLSPEAVASVQGAVQFTATDHWNASPRDTPPLAPVWGVCQGDEKATDVSITTSGIATCGKGAAGPYTVFVEDPSADSGPVCNVIDPCGRGCQKMASAQLTCQ